MQKLNLSDLQKIAPVLDANNISLYDFKVNVTAMNTQEFVKTINTLRLANKNKWYQWQGEVNGKQVALKGYNTWVQRLNVGNITHGGGMDISVKEFKEFLNICVH